MERVCWIFCALEPGRFRLDRAPGDLVIAADGGYAHLQNAGIRPDVILGDFDSLGHRPPEEDALVFPAEKDYTDSDLAIREGIARGYRRFCIFGALGGARLDHMIANFQLLSSLAHKGMRGYLAGEGQAAVVVEDSEIRFSARKGGYISIFAFGGQAQGVEIEGLKYSLSGASLDTRFPLGVSNEFTGQDARVAVKKGQLLILWQQDAAQFDPRNGVL